MTMTMTAPLFDVKAKLSQYVSKAQRGETVMLTKHGKISAVLMSADAYEELSKNQAASFCERAERWREKFGGLSREEGEAIFGARSREPYQARSVLW